MKSLFRDDYLVQVWREERQVSLEYAKFYKGIVDVGLMGLTHISFVPFFPKTTDNWPLRMPDNIDIVHSCNEARLFTAALADYTVTPDEELAGQKELIAFPSLPVKIKPYMGVLFYVTPSEFALMSQELLYIEKNYTLWANQYVPLSVIKDFECMKFILANILPLEQGYQANGGRLIMSGAEVQNPNEVAFMSNSAVMPELVGA